MKTSSKIAIAAAAVGAWLLGRRNDSVSGMAGVPIGAAKKYYVYAGYWENYISSEHMPAPYVLRKTFRSIDRALEYADNLGDEVIYCDNVKYDLPDWLYETLQDNDYEFFVPEIEVGKVDYSDFDGARIVAKDGSHAIEFTIYGGTGSGIVVSSEYKGKGKYGSIWEYLSHIGEYKTLSGAVRAAKKYWDERGIQYDPKDFENL